MCYLFQWTGHKKPKPDGPIVPLSPTIRYVPGMALLMKHRMEMMQMMKQGPQTKNGPVLFPETPEEAQPSTERDGTPVEPTPRPSQRYYKKKFLVPFGALNYHSRAFRGAPSSFVPQRRHFPIRSVYPSIPVHRQVMTRTIPFL